MSWPVDSITILNSVLYEKRPIPQRVVFKHVVKQCTDEWGLCSEFQLENGVSGARAPCHVSQHSAVRPVGRKQL